MELSCNVARFQRFSITALVHIINILTR
ncbi:hypothetical protein NITLEN_30097 [Nitrospira lenta]|uniref:Uncharacterized protein n=1 Tax=Nitrospira lenta TaxID=1436998 RepID=A0A330L7S6_9BACT|nr:hypothetical protein NITLEN_30097 [Nitrospira lenta]